MRARPIVWLAIIAAVLSLFFALFRLENLPDAPMSGSMEAVIEQADGDRLVLTDVTVDGVPIEGNVLLYSEPCGCEMKPGMRVRMRAELEILRAPVNPHGWDDRRWWIYKGAVYTCEGKIEAHSAYAPRTLRGDVRSMVLAHMDALWGETEESGVIRALLLGDEVDLSEETQEAFRRSGAAHLMAVSGLHVGFVAALVLFCFGWMKKRSTMQLIIVMLCMGLYALAAEEAFSVFRAMLMLAAGLLAGHFGRRADGMTSLAAAVLAVLVIDPMKILRAGFLMSVCAVLGIFMLTERLDRLLAKVVRPKWLRGSIAVSVAAQLGVLPVQIAVFGTFNVLSLLTNIAAVPLAAGIVMVGLPTVALHMVWPALAAIPGAAVTFAAKALMTMCEMVAAIPFAQITVEAPPALVLLSFMGLLFLCSPYYLEYGKHGRIAWAAGILTVFTVSLALWMPSVLKKDADKAVFLSVGTADSVVLQSSQGSVLIDTGWSGSQAVSYAQGEGIGFDAVVLTHADGDHAGGVERVLRDVPVGSVFVPKGMELPTEPDVPMMVLCTGDRFTVGAYDIEVLSPDVVSKGRENEDSLVLRVMHGDTTLLMMGDVTAEVEAQLELPDCDILKVAHHGSATATSETLLQKVQPEHAVISVGTSNRYGFPREEVLAQLEDADTQVWRTDEDNAVIVRFESDGYTIHGYEPPTLMEKWFGIG